MHISRSDLNLLTVFEAIYAQGGVTRAAEALNLTQPTVSHALARLRDKIGDPLFVRRGQRLEPTPAARQMIGPIQAALGAIDATIAGLGAFDPAAAHAEMLIGMHPLLDTALFPALAAQGLAEAPGITLASARYDRRHLEAELTAGTLACALDVFLPLSDRIRRARVRRAPLAVLARAEHPALQVGLSLDAYLAAGHILVSTRRRGGGPEDAALARLGLARRVAARCQQGTTALALAAGSDLLFTAPAASAGPGLALAPLPFDAPPLDTYLYWDAGADQDPASIWLRGLITRAAEAPPPD
ncbi:MAG: DNA-binding transcriptional LysR family regulator [Paracoccaceae bacterium]|jgi:DNA-binding transcriptional LysR family regulator